MIGFIMIWSAIASRLRKKQESRGRFCQILERGALSFKSRLDKKSISSDQNRICIKTKRGTSLMLRTIGKVSKLGLNSCKKLWSMNLSNSIQWTLWKTKLKIVIRRIKLEPSLKLKLSMKRTV